MSDFEVHFTGQDEIDVIHSLTGHRWSFVVLHKGPGRRKLDGPIPFPAKAADDGDLMKAACVFAHRAAMNTGRIDQ
jgi:hypothetical protein